ncbi:MAG: DUF2851 family protein [Mangrovibacterium sp.]
MKEEFLHFLWKHKLYDQQAMCTQSGKTLQVISPGFQNNDAGPDFTNARIIIDETVWVGNVEIHLKASDWKRHRHHEDKAYDSVILHVVAEDDLAVQSTEGEAIETFCMSYSPILANNYRSLLQNDQSIRCERKIKLLPSINIQFWLNRLIVERLEQKTELIKTDLERSTNNWNEVFYWFLAKSFGFKVNALPFELLAKALPLKILAKHQENIFQLEALLFGTAGLLHHPKVASDDYLEKLRKEYAFLQQKYQLKPLQAHLWKFARMRPLSFPTVRLAQFAKLIHQSYALFSKVIEIDDLIILRKLLAVQTSDYWETHFQFGNASARHIKNLGVNSINGLLINTIVPFLFVYGMAQDDDKLKERAMRFLEELPAEQNSIISDWSLAGIAPSSALQSQALLQLHKVYCLPKRCLQCAIGTGIVLKNNNAQEAT